MFEATQSIVLSGILRGKLHHWTLSFPFNHNMLTQPCWDCPWLWCQFLGDEYLLQLNRDLAFHELPRGGERPYIDNCQRPPPRLDSQFQEACIKHCWSFITLLWLWSQVFCRKMRSAKLLYAWVVLLLIRWMWRVHYCQLSIFGNNTGSFSSGLCISNYQVWWKEEKCWDVA